MSASGRIQVDLRTVAWIFLAIDFADRERAGLTDVVQAADAINHAVPLEHELRSSIKVLTNYGLILKQGKSFLITEPGRVVLSDAHNGAANVFDVWRALETKLGTLASI